MRQRRREDAQWPHDAASLAQGWEETGAEIWGGNTSLHLSFAIGFFPATR